MKEEDKSKLVEVFTGSPWEAELACHCGRCFRSRQ